MPRTKTPTILQMEEVECGAASLAIILAYHRRYVPLSELRTSCGITRDGSSAADIARAARGYGFNVSGYRYDVTKVRTLQAPFIVFWESRHFLVIEGFDSRGVFVNDPASGPRFVSDGEFARCFSGVALTLEIGPEFTAGGKRRVALADVGRDLRSSGPAIAYCVLAGVVALVPGLAVPLATKIFVDRYLVEHVTQWATLLLVGLAGAGVALGILTALQQWFLARLQIKLGITMSSRYVARILTLPIAFFMQRQPGEIAWRLSLNDDVAQLLSEQAMATILALVTVIVYASLMFHYDAFLTSVAAAVAALNVLALVLVSRRRVDVNRQLVREQGRLMNLTVQGLRTIETVKSTGGEPDFFARWSGQFANVSNLRQRLGMPTQILGTVPVVLAALNIAIILWIGGLRVIRGDMSVGTLVAFTSLTASFIAPFLAFVALGERLQTTTASLDRIHDVVSAPQIDATAPPLPAAPKRLDGAIELREVTFGYNRLAAPLIENFSMRLAPGRRIAIVGGSGSGKSTLAKLICGLYDPWSGEILFDGRRRNEIPAGVLHSSLALIDQDIFLFGASVRENLTLWDETMPETALIEALKDARIFSDISARPLGLDSRVLEAGVNFSGGQRQRIEIARAFARDPRILVLDEATSALDTVTELEIDDALRRRGCSCVIVAHRLSTIRDADEIIVLDCGKIVQRGRHDELKDAQGVYRDLVAS